MDTSFPALPTHRLVVLGTWPFNPASVVLISRFYLAFGTFVVCNCPFRGFLFSIQNPGLFFSGFILRVSISYLFLLGFENKPFFPPYFFPFSSSPAFSSHTVILETTCSADRVQCHSEHLSFISECDRDPSARGGLRLSVANGKMVEHQEDHSSSLHSTTSTSLCFCAFSPLYGAGTLKEGRSYLYTPLL